MLSEKRKDPIALEFAGFWRRLGAFVIDLFVLGAAASFLTPFHWFGFGNFFDLTTFIDFPILAIPFVAIANPISAMFKLIRTDGADVDTGHSITRLLGLVVAALPLFLGLLWIVFDERNQGWHDKIASTYVVKIPRLLDVENAEPPMAGA